jgi:hypothetical protein
MLDFGPRGKADTEIAGLLLPRLTDPERKSPTA